MKTRPPSWLSVTEIHFSSFYNKLNRIKLIKVKQTLPQQTFNANLAANSPDHPRQVGANVSSGLVGGSFHSSFSSFSGFRRFHFRLLESVADDLLIFWLLSIICLSHELHRKNPEHPREENASARSAQPQNCTC